MYIKVVGRTYYSTKTKKNIYFIYCNIIKNDPNAYAGNL